MPVINLRSLADAAGGATLTTATVKAQMLGAGLKPAVRVDGQDVILPALVPVELTDGVLDGGLELDQQVAGAYWHIEVSLTDSAGLTTKLSRDVTIPDGAGPFDFDELVSIDPDTLDPLDPIPPSAQDILDQAQEAADLATQIIDEDFGGAIEDYLTTNPLSADLVVDGSTNHVFTAADDTKLGGIAAGATVNSPDATLLARANHTGTQSADTITNGTANKVYTAAEKSKLGSIEDEATKNASDANLRARATHTGFQAISTVTGLQTALDAKAALDSPALTGNPTAPTQSAGNNSTRIATTAYADAAVTAGTPAASETVAGKIEIATLAEVTTGTDSARAVTPQGLKQQTDLLATKANPVFTGTVTIPDGALAIADTSGLQTALDGKAATSHTHSLSAVTDVTASAAEVNVLDGMTASTTELNFIDGVTSALQTQLDAKAPLASPALTGNPTAPTQSPGNNSTRLATTAYADAAASAGTPDASTTVAGKIEIATLAEVTTGTDAVRAVTPQGLKQQTDLLATAANPVFTGTVTIPDGALAIADTSGLQTALDLKAPLASPTFTGNPVVPTQSAGNNSTRAASTAYVDGAVATSDSAQTTALALKANLASPTFTGTPAAPTPTASDNSTKIATTAYVDTADALKANLASPTFTGTPAAPTASGSASTTQIASTAQVQAAITARAASDTAAGIVELATDAETQTGTDTSRAITPANLAARTATETRAGVVELATLAEVTTGTDTARAVTPQGLQQQYALLAARLAVLEANVGGVQFIAYNGTAWKAWGGTAYDASAGTSAAKIKIGISTQDDDATDMPSNNDLDLWFSHPDQTV